MNTAKPTEASFYDAASTLIEHFAQTRPMHANSLLVSVYGDTICPHIDTIWLGILIKLVEPLGISQRLVRTSVFRLSEKGVLVSQQVGRRSYYSLTERAHRQFLSASKRIYASQALAWDKQWRLVLTSLGKLSNEQRETVRKELLWLGFSRITIGVYAHPTADLSEVQRVIRELELGDGIAVLKAGAADSEQVPVTNILISDCFDLKQSEHNYQMLIDDFQGIHEAAQSAESLDPKLCFLVKTLLIHRFRHILLKEPELPDALVAEGSASWRARELVGNLYKLIYSAADEYFYAVCETQSSTFPKIENPYFNRFVALRSI